MMKINSNTLSLKRPEKRNTQNHSNKPLSFQGGNKYFGDTYSSKYRDQEKREDAANTLKVILNNKVAVALSLLATVIVGGMFAAEIKQNQADTSFQPITEEEIQNAPDLIQNTPGQLPLPTIRTEEYTDREFAAGMLKELREIDANNGISVEQRQNMQEDLLNDVNNVPISQEEIQQAPTLLQKEGEEYLPGRLSTDPTMTDRDFRAGLLRELQELSGKTPEEQEQERCELLESVGVNCNN